MTVGNVAEWLNDVLLHTTLRKHLALMREVLHLLAEAGYSFGFSQVEFLGVMVGRQGVRPAPSKVEGLQEMLATVGEVRTFLGIAGFPRDFVADFSTLVAPISN